MGDFFKQLNVKNILALLGLTGCLLIVAALINMSVPHDNKDLFNILATLFFREVLSPVFRFYFPTKEQKAEAKQ